MTAADAPAFALGGGFADPVMEAQATFRALMDAMARPGTICPLAAAVSPPAPLPPVAAAVALALCDHDTPLWLDPALSAGETVRTWLAFHCGAPLTATPAEAMFALVVEPARLPDLALFGQGTQEYPDRSTTLILAVDTLEEGPMLRLEGPGIEGLARLAAAPLPPRFAAQWAANAARFPLGVDLVLPAAGAVACLPRTARIVEGEG